MAAPLVPLGCVPPTAAPATVPAPLAALPDCRGITSMLVTVLLDAPAWLEPEAPVLAPLPVCPVDTVALLPVPAMLPAVPEPVSALLPVAPIGSLELARDPLSLVLPVLPSVELPLDVWLRVSVVPHAASPRASTHAKSTLCCLRFMINSFGWVFSVCA
jgi:hypothetical protein